MFQYLGGFYNWRKKTVIFAVCLVFLAGYFIGTTIAKIQIQNLEDKLAAEIFSNVFPLNSITGEITAINSNKNILTAEIDSIYGVNIPQNYKEKQLLVDSRTKIILRESKEGSAQGPSATAFTAKEISVDELKVGDIISFTIAQQQENKNILSPSFITGQINISR